MREVTIRGVLNGYVVSVGCQTLVFQTREALVGELARYLERPVDVENEYLETYGQMGAAPTPAMQPPTMITNATAGLGQWAQTTHTGAVPPGYYDPRATPDPHAAHEERIAHAEYAKRLAQETEAEAEVQLRQQREMQ